MTERELICIRCPIGCSLSAETEVGRVVSVSGNQCGRGEAYAKKELMNPTRTLTTTVKIRTKSGKVLPVKTKTEIPKDKIFECMNVLCDVEVDLPVQLGDTIVTNIADTDVDVVAIKTMV